MKKILLIAVAAMLAAGCQSGSQGSGAGLGAPTAGANCVAYDRNGNPYRTACP